jgi:hypothetical protein
MSHARSDAITGSFHDARGQFRTFVKMAAKSNGKNVSKKRKAITTNLPEGALRKVKILAHETVAESLKPTTTLADLNVTNVTEAQDMTEDEVSDKIETLAVSVVDSIMSGSGMSYHVPSRSTTHQLYIPELDRLVLKQNVKFYAIFSPCLILLSCPKEHLHLLAP